MKKDVLVTKHFCDVCGAESESWNCCDHCAKDFCYDCRKKHMVEYTHSVFFSGSSDGRYCLECDNTLAHNGDKRHAAYKVVESLKRENKGFYVDFKERAEAAEKAVKSFSSKR